MEVAQRSRSATRDDELALLYRTGRYSSRNLGTPLSDADATVQSMPDASPAKWHLAHTTWFFEEFVLTQRMRDYAVYNSDFRYLFNSYYEALGPRVARHQRGLLTRPSIAEVMAYRARIDDERARAA